jgi:hypothetical protein
MEQALSLKPGDLLNQLLQQKERTNREREKKREIVYRSALTAEEIEKVLRRHEEAKSKRIRSTARSATLRTPHRCEKSTP